MYLEDLPPIHVSIYNPHRVPKKEGESLGQFSLPPETHPDTLPIVYVPSLNLSLDEMTATQADPVMEKPKVQSEVSTVQRSRGKLWASMNKLQASLQAK